MLNLVVIGDSIAKGYGSTDYNTDSFGAILGQKMSADVTNLGIIGLDSSGLIEKLQTEKFQTAIKDADVICLSIGSNDLLKPFLSSFASIIGVEGEEKELFVKIQDKLAKTAKQNPVKAADLLSKAMKKLTDNKELWKACKNFSGQFKEITDIIHEINPDVLIYADNVYNPYYGVAYEYEGISVFNISQLCEPYIQKINEAFVKSDDYTVVDMYSIFRQTGYTHVKSGSVENMGDINMDPHPNDEGYRMMADYIYTKLDTIVPYVVSAEFNYDKGYEDADVLIVFSESVRLIKDKEIKITSKDGRDSFVYVIPEDMWIEASDDEIYTLQLNLSDFSAQKGSLSEKLEDGEKYVLSVSDGAIKDKGNNHLKEEEVINFYIPKEEAVVTTANNALVKGVKDNGLYIILSVGVIIILIIVISVKKIKSIDRNKKEE